MFSLMQMFDGVRRWARRTRRRLARPSWAGLVGALALGLGSLPASAADEHAAHEEHAEHGDHAAHGDHSLGEINWFYGFLGEDAEIEEPTVAWRKPGMPAPLGAYLINTAILFTLLFRLGKAPVQQFLSSRRNRIMQGIDAATKMREEAAGQLAQYEAKLAKLDSEIARIRTEMQQSAEAERQRVLGETKKRCARMEADARALIQHELKAARERLHQEVVSGALRGAERLLKESVTAADQDRLGEEYLATLGASVARAVGSTRSSGGQA